MIQDSSTISWNKAGKGLCDVAETNDFTIYFIMPYTLQQFGDVSKLGKEVKNQGETVLWSDIENDKVADIKSPFDIRLEVIDTASKEILAKTKLSINPYKGVYEIEK